MSGSKAAGCADYERDFSAGSSAMLLERDDIGRARPYCSSKAASTDLVTWALRPASAGGMDVHLLLRAGGGF